MERIKEIDRHYVGAFTMLDYGISHCELLMRCSNLVNDVWHNLDLRFEGVDYMELPTHLQDVYICNGGEKDWEYILAKFNDTIYNTPPNDYHKLFKIMSGGRVYYILACSLLITSNTLGGLQSSIKTDLYKRVKG